METCCICLDNTWCYWKCHTCNDGRVCKSCDHKMDYTDEDGCLYTSMTMPHKCPICRTPNMIDSFMRQLINDEFEGGCEWKPALLDKYPVLYIFNKNLGYSMDYIEEEVREAVVSNVVNNIFRNVIASN